MFKGIKICGVSDLETLKFIIDHKFPPKFIGFITNYKKSKRYVENNDLEKLLKIEKKNINFVSVLVNPNNEELEKIKNFNFDYYQLYDVSPERTKEIKKKYEIKIITALTIDKAMLKSIKIILILPIWFFLMEKEYEKSIGFDHKLLNKLPNSLNKMIAGNIKIDDIPTFKNKDFYVDLSGALEDGKGKKDIKKINKLLNFQIYEIKKEYLL